jgi:hypothetical protein
MRGNSDLDRVLELGATGVASVGKIEGLQRKVRSYKPVPESRAQAGSSCVGKSTFCLLHLEHPLSQWHPKCAHFPFLKHILILSPAEIWPLRFRAIL